MIEVTLLGTGSPIPDPDRAGPSTLVRAGGQIFLIDCGRGVQQRAAAVGVLRADYVFASQRHEALLAALGLPTFPASWGRRHLLEDGDGYEGPPLTASGGGT